MNRPIFLLCLLLTSQFLGAQNEHPSFTPATERITSFEQRKKLEASSLVNAIEFEQIGPVVQSGRVSEVAVDPMDPTHFFVAYASGGLWETHNNGTSFKPMFQNEMVMSLGAIAVDWKNGIIWLGSGEVNSSRSSYSGTGIFKSTDGGKTFSHMGLGESHHIGRIVIHPENPEVVWVAVLGHLYSPNMERGIYKTEDGGKTWNRTLFVNSNTGAIDLVIDPDDPQVLYASTWERERHAWDFSESGPGSGIYKTTDGGSNWVKIDMGKDFPTGQDAGRIGLDITSHNGHTVIYASVDHQGRRPPELKKEDGITKDQLRNMDKESFLKLEETAVKNYLDDNNFPDEYSYEKIRKMIEKEEIKPIALVEYVEDANTLLFDTPVVGLQVYRSDNQGKSWKKTHEGYLEDIYYSYGYYFGQIRVSPINPEKIYVMGVPVLKSEDGGKTFIGINGDNVHGDHHELWINPANDKHLILGNDGGINISYDDGKNWIKCNSPAVGQFYAIAVDMDQPFNVYGGLQDNGVWKGPHNHKESSDWQQSGHYAYEMILGGDGMQVAVDTRDNSTVYTGFQFGNYFRVNTTTGKPDYITPKHKLGERPLRWNWQSPVHLSVHNQDILYFGANKLFRSMAMGENFEPISPDLTKGGKKGDVAFSTLTTIHESPLQFGLLYAGTDDGWVHCSRDGGHSWQNITPGLPEDMWISRVFASGFELSRIYVSLNGYRWDNFTPMCYVSEDYGVTWKRIATDLPLEPVNVIKEDPVNPNLLYIGTDHGLYVSLDRGETTMLMNNNLPAVPVHDLIVHPRDKKLVVGTHGRSLFLADVSALQQLTAKILVQKLFAFDISNKRYSNRWGSQSWYSETEPEMEIPFYSSENGNATIEISTDEGQLLYAFTHRTNKGLNYAKYDLSIDKISLSEYNKFVNKGNENKAREIEIERAANGKFYLYEGIYKVLIHLNGTSVEKTFEVE
ncbi:MAG: glycosyl hydrolase [Saprospiraceae bacterium]|nr:glycosyl hydrolase [Saprospiraceae bacterium]MCB9322219.1 glycosyl hydrolase [Lewinellaceae bacterium]